MSKIQLTMVVSRNFTDHDQRWIIEVMSRIHDHGVDVNCTYVRSDQKGVVTQKTIPKVMTYDQLFRWFDNKIKQWIDRGYLYKSVKLTGN